MSLLKPPDNISNQCEYILIIGGGEGVVVHSKWCIVGIVLRQQKVSRTGTGRSTKLPSGNTDHTGSGLTYHQNKSTDIFNNFSVRTSRKYFLGCSASLSMLD